jgi:hypothetical protein
MVIFVAIDDEGRSIAVPAWTPDTDAGRERQIQAIARIEVRRLIEQSMGAQTYTATAPPSASPSGYWPTPRT